MQFTKLIVLLMLPTTLWAAQNCVMQEKIVNRSKVVIEEMGDIKRDVVPWTNNQKKCIVNFRARIGQEWYQGYGEYIWDGELPVNDACGAAATAGKKELTNRVKPSNIISEDVLICNDDTKLDAVRKTQIGSIVDITQLKSNPNYPRRFYHNGTECKWFTEVGFTGNNVLQYQGIACMLEPTKWVVVDKF
jgi:hypothetical protein